MTPKRPDADPHQGVVHVLVFSAFPAVGLYLGNAREAGLADGLISLGAAWLLGLAAYAVACGVMGRTPLATAWAVIGAVAFLTYGHVRNLCIYVGVTVFDVDGFLRNRYSFLVTAVIALSLMAASYAMRRRSEALKTLLKIASQGLCIAMLVNALVQGFGSGGERLSLVRPAAFDASALATVRPETPRPDVYYLIFDRYGHGTELKSQLGFDNTELIRFLEDRGFVLPPEAFANYWGSLLSLASALNMQHLQFVPEQLGADAETVVPVYALFHNHEVGRFLRAAGYTTYHFGNRYIPTSFDRHADHNVNECIWSGSVYLDHFFDLTLLNPVLEAAFSPAVSQARIFERLEGLARRPGPKFVFAHLLLPHAPYVFAADGSVLPRNERKLTLERYLGQLRFVNRRLRQLVATVEAESSRPFVMVLQSDEGPHQSDVGISDLPDRLKLRGRIFNALRLPGVPAADVRELKSPVNTFRFIFNHYFDAGLEPLADRAYLSTQEKPYRFVDVTEKVAIAPATPGSPPAPGPTAESGARRGTSKGRRGG